MKALPDQMVVIGAPLSNGEMIGYILAGLESRYKSLTSSLTFITTPIKLTQFYFFLLWCEAMQEHQSTREWSPS
jgi:hypothetical protein